MCAIDAAGVSQPVAGIAAPYNHGAACITSGPHGRVEVARRRSVLCIGCDPRISVWNVLTAAVRWSGKGLAAPNDHLRPGPNGGVKFAAVWRDVTGGGPAVSNRIIPSADVWEVKVLVSAAPNNHFRGRPDSGMQSSRGGRINGGGRTPAIAGRVISPSGVKRIAIKILPAPDDHLAACPYGRVVYPGIRRIRINGSPNVCSWIVCCARIQETKIAGASPDDHFAAGPHGGVKGPGQRRDAGCSSPGVRSGVVSCAAV